MIYLQNRNEKIKTVGHEEFVTEHYITIYLTAPHIGEQASNTQVNDLRNPTSVRGSVKPSITASRILDIAFLVHRHPPTSHPYPSWPADFSSQNPALKSRGLWTAIVTPNRVYFTGPNGEYFYLPSSDFINAGKTNGISVSIGTVTIGEATSPSP